MEMQDNEILYVLAVHHTYYIIQRKSGISDGTKLDIKDEHVTTKNFLYLLTKSAVQCFNTRPMPGV